VVIRKIIESDQNQVFDLYSRVTEIPGGLARLKNEVTREYVQLFIEKTLSHGVGFVAENDNKQILGEIHAYSPDLYCFSHVLSELTIAIEPNHQGHGVGRLLFETFLSHITSECPDILRIELISRESNIKAIEFYSSLGFVAEGKLTGRIRNTDGTYEADVPMAWHRH